jgi:hypothetical protein
MSESASALYSTIYALTRQTWRSNPSRRLVGTLGARRRFDRPDRRRARAQIYELALGIAEGLQRPQLGAAEGVSRPCRCRSRSHRTRPGEQSGEQE